MLGYGFPTLGNLVKGEVGIAANGKVSDLGSQFDQTAVGELAILGL
jgi:hypothetical protein